MKRLHMDSIGKYPIWFTGSRKTVWRTVYSTGTTQDRKYYCIWYDQAVEIVHDAWGYHTVEQY